MRNQYVRSADLSAPAFQTFYVPPRKTSDISLRHYGRLPAKPMGKISNSINQVVSSVYRQLHSQTNVIENPNASLISKAVALEKEDQQATEVPLKRNFMRKVNKKSQKRLQRASGGTMISAHVDTEIQNNKRDWKIVKNPSGQFFVRLQTRTVKAERPTPEVPTQIYKNKEILAERKQLKKERENIALELQKMRNIFTATCGKLESSLRRLRMQQTAVNTRMVYAAAANRFNAMKRRKSVKKSKKTSTRKPESSHRL